MCLKESDSQLTSPSMGRESLSIWAELAPSLWTQSLSAPSILMSWHAVPVDRSAPAHRDRCIPSVSQQHLLGPWRSCTHSPHTSSSQIHSIELLLNKSVNGRRERRHIDTFQLRMGFELESNKGLYWHIAFLWRFTTALIECLYVLHVTTVFHNAAVRECVFQMYNECFSRRTSQQQLSPENWKGHQLEAKGQSILDMYKMSPSDGLKAYDTVSGTRRCCEIPCQKVRRSLFMVLHLFVQMESDKKQCVEWIKRVQTLLSFSGRFLSKCQFQKHKRSHIGKKCENGLSDAATLILTPLTLRSRIPHPPAAVEFFQRMHYFFI